MIIDRVEAKDMLNAMEVPTLNLAAMVLVRNIMKP